MVIETGLSEMDEMIVIWLYFTKDVKFIPFYITVK